MTNQEIFDALVVGEIHLRRLTRDELVEVLSWLQQQIASVDQAILRAGNLDRRTNLDALLAELEAIRSQVFKELDRRLRTFAAGVTDHETALVAALALVTASQAIGPAALADIINKRAINGQLFNEWLEGMRADEITRLNRALRLSTTVDASREELVQEARRALRGTGRNVEGLAQSLATHVSSQVREELVGDAPDLVAWRWVSILDGKTSDICRARSGKVYPISQPHPVPPAHPRCRSSIVPVFAGQGPVREENYGEWLARQSVARQNEILGPARAAMFRSGRAELDDFVEEPSGRRVPLDGIT